MRNGLFAQWRREKRTGKDLHGAWILIAVALLAAPGLGSASTTFSDDFTTLDGQVWEPGTSLPLFSGVQATTPTVIDGRTVIDLTMPFVGNNSRMGYQTKDSFEAADIRLEAVFKTLGPAASPSMVSCTFSS